MLSPKGSGPRRLGGGSTPPRFSQVLSKKIIMERHFVTVIKLVNEIASDFGFETCVTIFGINHVQNQYQNVKALGLGKGGGTTAEALAFAAVLAESYSFPDEEIAEVVRQYLEHLDHS
jgi:hypothetical protein